MWIFSQLLCITNSQFGMKDALISWKNKIKQAEMVTIKTMILRDKLKAIVYTLEMPKTYGVVYNKCIVRVDHTTLPCGF